jgi:protein-tyrosine phosphatase
MKFSLRRLIGAGPPKPALADAELRVLFVCAGNICRSPTAEGVLRKRLADAGLVERIAVASAGTHAHVGSPPDPRAQRHAVARGFDLSAIRARQVIPDDFMVFDHILAMDDDNLAWLADASPAKATARVGPLMQHALRHAALTEVPDPYYGPPEGFDHVLDLLEDACSTLAQALERELHTRARQM